MSEPLPWGVGTPAALEEILALAQRATGIDFPAYKRTVLRRRVEHRARMREAASLEDYLKLLGTDPGEVQRLRSALLIQTTGMFRGARTFALLRERALPELAARRRREGGHTLRAWVPACATGEEAWSVAMCLEEARGAAGTGLDFEVLASDVDGEALARGASGLIPPESAAEVPAELAARFLARAGGRARVTPALARQVRFVRHDALDPVHPTPPAAVLASFDLISCRNLLIYLGPEAQERLSQALVRACEPGGLLLLDESESPRGPVERLVRLESEAGVWARR